MFGLIDPLAIDSRDKRRFGHLAFDARFRRAQLARVLRFARSLYQRFFFRKDSVESFANDFAFTRDEFNALQRELRTEPEALLQLSALHGAQHGAAARAETPDELAGA